MRFDERKPDHTETVLVADFKVVVYSFGTGDEVLLCLNGGPGLPCDYLRDGEASVFGAMFSVIKDIQPPDDRTIVFTLTEPTTPFLSFLALFAAAILPEQQVTGDYEGFLKASTGAGAFRMAEWSRGGQDRTGKKRALLGSRFTET
jgi:ABC-type transport system substrate-binding protein